MTECSRAESEDKVMYYDYQQDIELDDEVKGLIRFKRNSWNYDSYKILSASEELRLIYVIS